MIPPHGGELTERIVDSHRASELQARAGQWISLVLPERQQCDLEMLGMGAFSPLTGFMGSKDFQAVCTTMRLDNGRVWSIPITCHANKTFAQTIKIGQPLALRNAAGDLLGAMVVEEKYDYDKTMESKWVYKTESAEHPGVAVSTKQGEVCLAGPVEVIPTPHRRPFADHYLTPAQTRDIFQKRGWKSIVAFQTRNPIHRAHEYLTKCALEICEGLLIHPLVGQTQPGDIPADVRMRCYQTLLEKYYQKDRTLLAVMPAAMRYAGPREAILHALIRQNYGCTHFIVGRDHAGVGHYYDSYDAQKIFDELKPGEIGITPLRFENSGWCNRCEGMVSAKTCPHPDSDKTMLSGTKVREMLVRGERPPMEFTRPEIADILIESMKKS